MPDKTPDSGTSTARALWLVGTAIALATSLALLLIGPGAGSTCLILATTGVSCPGCGMTRAAAALLRGDWSTMWAMHPLAPFVTVQVVIVWVVWGWAAFRRHSRFDETWLLWLLVGDFALLLVVWFVRLVTGTLLN